MTFRHLRNVRGFFSDYFLGSVFGRPTRGRKKTSDRDTDLGLARFRRIHERAEGRAQTPAECRERFVRPFLRDVLGFHLGTDDDRIHGLYPSADAEAAGLPRLALAYCGAWDEDLEAGRGHAQPVRRLEDALAASGVAHGLLVTGERLRLVRAPGDGPRGACLEVDLDGLAEVDDLESFAAMLRLFSIDSFTPDEAGKVPLEEVEAESRRHAEKVTDDLKAAVFHAAESLGNALVQDALERRGPGARLTDDEVRRFRDAALLALYRILFILYAEARDPRLQDHPLYRDSYSAQGLLDEILGSHGRAWPANRCSLWDRLRALFRIFDQGLPAITPWQNIPPRGGDFFRSDTEGGRILEDARLPEPVVVSLMLHLGTTQPRRGVGRERVSFRELDIENLGAVYEGLLEFEPRVAGEPVIELKVQGHVYALAPSEVVRLCQQKALSLKGDIEIVAGTVAESLHPAAVDDDDLAGLEDEEDEEEAEDDGDAEDAEDKGLKKGAPALLLRRLEPGTFHFVPGPGRKGSGSFYTPRPLAQDLVRHALGPLVEGRSAADIEKLRVLDPACGSAHFLVEAMRFLGQALHRAYVVEGNGNPPAAFRSTTGQGWDDGWKVPDDEARASGSEARAWCKRRIAEKCLFGVDLNPTAVQLARVALWVESVAGDRPLTYFEHHVRVGNSLVGSWLDGLELPPLTDGKRSSVGGGLLMGMFQAQVRSLVQEAAALRRLIDHTPPEALQREGIEPDTVAEQDYKERLHQRADKILSSARLLSDLRSASLFVPDIWKDWETLCSQVGTPGVERLAEGRPWAAAFRAARARDRYFHWELEFPEVLLDPDRAGFDVILGNPPWDKVLPARKDFYAATDVLIRAFTGADLDRRIRELHGEHPGLQKAFDDYSTRTRTTAQFLRNGGDFPLSKARTGAAHEDLSKYFVDRALRLARKGGAVGLVVPSVFYNGDGCVALRRYLLTEATVDRFYAFENRKKIFPIHSSYKFVSLVVRKVPSGAPFQVAFMRHDLEELDATARWREPGNGRQAGVRTPAMVELTPSEVEILSPDTYAFLEYRGSRDRDLTKTMSNGLIPLADAGSSDGWKARFVSWRAHEIVYNSSEDKDLWTDAAGGKLFSPERILSTVPQSFPDLQMKMREAGFWPVFEGKQAEQFVLGTRPVRWWLSLEKVEKKYGRVPSSQPPLVFRRIASNTNERTMIATILPPFSAASEQLPAIRCSGIDESLALQVLNSFCFDFLLRLRSGGSTLAFTYILPIPVPSALSLKSVSCFKPRYFWETGERYVADDDSAWEPMWSMNRAVAEAYGLGPDDFEHILSAFPVMARKRPKFMEYLKARTADWNAGRQ